MLAFLYRGTESDGPNFIVAARKVSDERQDRPPDSPGVKLRTEPRDPRTTRTRKFAFLFPDFRSKAIGSYGISVSFPETSFLHPAY